MTVARIALQEMSPEDCSDNKTNNKGRDTDAWQSSAIHAREYAPKEYEVGGQPH